MKTKTRDDGSYLFDRVLEDDVQIGLGQPAAPGHHPGDLAGLGARDRGGRIDHLLLAP